MAKKKKEKDGEEHSTEGLTSKQIKINVLEKLRIECNDQFGANTLVKMDNSSFTAVPKQSSGIVGLDDILGGGYGQGRIVEIYGPESSGKTTIALEAIAEAQRLGGLAAFIDTEHALDPVYAASLGVDMSALWLSQPDGAEQALELIRKLIGSGSLDIIVLDSVAALTPTQEQDKEMGESTMAVVARLMSTFCRIVVGPLNKTKTRLIMLNQTRDKIGGYGGKGTTGGNALKFYASQRLEIRKTETNTVSDEAVSNTVLVKVIKNKLAPPFKSRSFMLRFGVGIDKYNDILELAVENKLIKKAGAWYSYEESNIGQGSEKTLNYLKENDEFFETIKTKVIKILLDKQDAKREALVKKKKVVEIETEEVEETNIDDSNEDVLETEDGDSSIDIEE